MKIHQGSLQQQALVYEAKRVLGQPQNRGLKLELITGVAAVGMGRNSISAILTRLTPSKKVWAWHRRVWVGFCGSFITKKCSVVVQRGAHRGAFTVPGFNSYPHPPSGDVPKSFHSIISLVPSAIPPGALKLSPRGQGPSTPTLESGKIQVYKS